MHLLDELNYSFSVIGVSETKISTVDFVNFDTSIPGYKFEYVPTPLSSGGVGMYVKHFSSVGHRLASNFPPPNRHFSEYLRGNYMKSFFFDPVTPNEIEREILSIPLNKAHGLYSCPNRILRSARHILSIPLAKLMNLSVISGEYPSKLKHAKVTPVFKDDDETDPTN